MEAQAINPDLLVAVNEWRNNVADQAGLQPALLLKEGPEWTKRPLFSLNPFPISNLIHVRYPNISPNAEDTQKSKPTRQPTQYDKSIPQESRLEMIVFVPNLVDQYATETRERLLAIQLDLSLPHHVEFLHRVAPYYRGKDLPPYYQSEYDIERAFMDLFGQPIQALLRALMSQSVPDDEDDLKDVHIGAPPYSNKVNSDVVCFKDHTRPAVTVELKTPGVPFESTASKSISFRSLHNPNFKGILFRWPHGKFALKGGDIVSGLLVQIWSQLIFYDCSFAILSNISETTFFYRKKSSNTLYMSRTYPNTDSRICLYITTWFALGAEIIRADIDSKLPNEDVSRSWWKEDKINIKNPEYAGVCPSTLAGLQLERVTANSPDSQKSESSTTAPTDISHELTDRSSDTSCDSEIYEDDDD